MSILPRRVEDLLNFCELHIAPWSAQPAQIGLTPQQVTQFSNLTTAARAAHTGKLEAEQSARVATAASRAAVRDLRRQAGDLIRLIKAYAQSQPDPAAVYQAAQIPEPQPPSPAPPPGQPFDFRVTLDPLGLITLRWKANNPPGVGGTVYNVRRKLAGESAYAFIGATGSRAFTDETLPAGTAQAQYIVQGQRGGAVGPQSFPFTINFGVPGPGGPLTIASAYEERAKAAA